MSTILDTDGFQSYLGKTVNIDQAEAAVNAVNTWIEKRTGRCWGTTKQVTERYNYTPVLWLRHPDVVSVDAVTLGLPTQTQTTLPANSYYVNPFGRLTLVQSLVGSYGASLDLTSRFLNDYLGVTYTYGVGEVPDDLYQAALGIAAGFYNWAQDGSRDLVSASVGSYKLEYRAKSGGSGNGPASAAAQVSEQLFTIVDGYRVRRV